MSSTVHVAQPGESRSEVSQISVSALVWILALLIACYVPILMRLVNQWMEDEDMGHGFFVPVIAGYIAWQKRDELLAANLKTNSLGLLIIAYGACQSIIGMLGVELFLSRTAFLVSVYGCIIYLGGMKAVRILALPMVMLLFMVPIPAIIYNQITFPLQLLASRVAEFALGLFGIPVLRDGNVLELPSQKLSVVEACSGIRSLLSLTFLSLVYGFFFDSKPWMKWVLLGTIIPIAITANASRVTLTGLLSEVNPEYAKGVYHSMSGWVVFMVALVLLVSVHQLINRVYARFAKEKQS